MQLAPSFLHHHQATPGPVPPASTGGSSAEPVDTFVPGNPEDSKQSSSNRFHKVVRFGLDAANTIGGDLPALAMTGANIGVLPLSSGLKSLLSNLNGPNVGMNLVGDAIDAKQLRDVLKNPNSTKTDKRVEETHFLLSDIIPTLTSALPLVIGLSNPIVAGVFVATQLVGVVADLAKVGYDIHRKGEQG